MKKFGIITGKMIICLFLVYILGNWITHAETGNCGNCSQAQKDKDCGNCGQVRKEKKCGNCGNCGNQKDCSGCKGTRKCDGTGGNSNCPEKQAAKGNETVTPKSDEGSNADALQDQKETYGAHRTYTKIHFDDADMDFTFLWYLGTVHNGGCEIGEAFYAVSQMKDGDPQSWVDQWKAMAQRVEKAADESLKNGHKVSAREAYFRAAAYNRAVLSALYPLKPEFKELGLKSRSLFKKAGKLCDPPVEYFEIPFEGTVLPGYFIRGGKPGEKRKTLVMIGGGETFCEDLYYYIAPEALARGYNFVTADIPGQGVLPAEGKPFRYDAEVPLKAVMDYVVSRPEVDGEKIAMYGISGGGYFVPRAAINDKRIKAIAVNSAVVDDYKIFSSMDFAAMTDEQIQSWNPFKLATNKVIAWRWGLKPENIRGLVEANKGYVFDPKKITCPALAMVGEGEYANEEVQRQQKEFIDGVQNSKKKLVVTKQDMGASSHCISDNRSLMAATLFDWLDEVFKP